MYDMGGKLLNGIKGVYVNSVRVKGVRASGSQPKVM